MRILGWMAVIAIPVLVVVYFLPPSNPHPGRLERLTTRAVLTDLLLAEEIYALDSGVPTANLAALDTSHFRPAEGVRVSVEIVEFDGRAIGYHAVSEHERVTLRCEQVVVFEYLAADAPDSIKTRNMDRPNCNEPRGTER